MLYKFTGRCGSQRPQDLVHGMTQGRPLPEGRQRQTVIASHHPSLFCPSYLTYTMLSQFKIMDTELKYKTRCSGVGSGVTGLAMAAFHADVFIQLNLSLSV